MKINEIEKFKVKGISVRTDNVSEMNPETGKIGPLWETFFAEIAPKLAENSRVFGLYTNYESDHTGKFDVVAGSDIINSDETLSEHRVNSGKYLVFSATGAMPQAVIDLWGEIWAYFNSEHCQHKRAYTTDFEFYKSENEIEIFIAVE